MPRHLTDGMNYHHGAGVRREFHPESLNCHCLSKKTIYKLTRECRLPAFRIGKERHRRFRKEDLDRALQPGKEMTNINRFLALTAKADMVLAEVWDNEKDAVYGRI